MKITFKTFQCITEAESINSTKGRQVNLQLNDFTILTNSNFLTMLDQKSPNNASSSLLLLVYTVELAVRRENFLSLNVIIL